MSLESRIGKLESQAGGPCPVSHRPLRMVVVQHAQPEPEVERCPNCGEWLDVLVRIVYERPAAAGR